MSGSHLHCNVVVPGAPVSPRRKVCFKFLPSVYFTFLCTCGRYTDLDSFLREEWEAGFLTGWDANDMLALLRTWQTGDVSLVRDGGDYESCLKGITARGLVMPCKTDLYFPVSKIYFSHKNCNFD